MSAIADYLKDAGKLPPAPTVLPRLLNLLTRDDVDADKVVELIRYDPALTATVLQLANSALFGAAAKIADLYEAVARLGFQQVYMLVAAVCGASVLGGEQAGYGMRDGELWRHSVTSAVAAQQLSLETGDDPNSVFTAALLHDLGKIALSDAMSEGYERIIEGTEIRNLSLLDVEREILGFNHAELGAALLRRWNFPETLVAAVQFHHDPASAPPGMERRLAAFAHVGNLIAYVMGQGYGNSSIAQCGKADAFGVLGLDPELIDSYVLRVFEHTAVIETLFNVRR